MKKPSPKAKGVPKPTVGGQAKKDKRDPIDLLVKPGKVIGRLTREEIYADRLHHIGFPDPRSRRPKR